MVQAVGLSCGEYATAAIMQNDRPWREAEILLGCLVKFGQSYESGVYS